MTSGHITESDEDNVDHRLSAPTTVKAQQDAVNATGTRVLAGLRTMLDEKLDTPTQFTPNAFRLWKARGRRTDAAIVNKAIQQEYLRPLFEGGTRTDDVLPSKEAIRNRYGNMTRGYKRTAVAKGAFWKTAKSDVRMLFVDDGVGGLIPIAFKAKRTEYDAIMDPTAEANALVAEILPEEAEKAFQKAFNG